MTDKQSDAGTSYFRKPLKIRLLINNPIWHGGCNIPCVNHKWSTMMSDATDFEKMSPVISLILLVVSLLMGIFPGLLQLGLLMS
ncbi:MAG: hypothetical protein IBX50_16460 [Marinospirillum sp.]|uniref:hypothetical protein n=1 Tax=Marinospirillum sp. TaxID=2183934 RepID=UPI0019F00513|nr:hypothetical protein [Marinospirillum sp.]MBE0508282.1 hypothetical protein [Marinospirillum sp.]